MRLDETCHSRKRSQQHYKQKCRKACQRTRHIAVNVHADIGPRHTEAEQTHTEGKSDEKSGPWRRTQPEIEENRRAEDAQPVLVKGPERKDRCCTRRQSDKEPEKFGELHTCSIGPVLVILMRWTRRLSAFSISNRSEPTIMDSPLCGT